MNDGDTSSSESDDDDDNDKMVIDLEEEPPSSKTDPKTPPSTPSPSPLQTTRRMTRSQTRISPVPMEVLEAATSRRRKRSVDREDAGSAEKSSATKKSVKGRKASGGSTESSGASKPTQTKKRGRRPAILDTDTEEEEQNEVKVPEAANESNESNVLDPNLMEMLKKSDEFVRNRNAEAAKQEQPPSSAATSQPAPNKEVLSATVAVESGAKLTPAAMTAPVTPTPGTSSQPGPSQPTSLGSFVSDALARLKAEKHNHFLAKTQQRQPLNFLGDIMSAQTSMFEPKQRMEAEEGSQAKETKFVILISVITFDRIGRFSVLKDLVARTTKILPFE